MTAGASEARAWSEDELAAALAQLGTALEATAHLVHRALEKRDLLSRQHGDGRPWIETMLSEEPPALHAILNELLQPLLEGNTRYRRAAVQALYREGFTMQRIAEVFGVSRQRISHILHSDTEG
jgi:DNA-directed RNA polymerase specialized sigma24 family protein